MPMRRIDYYFTVLSPFSYLAGDRLERIASAHGATVSYHPFDIREVGGATGWTPPANRHPARQKYRLQELARISEREGLPINLRPAHWPTNAEPASVAIATAGLSGRNVGALVHAFLRAVWAEERDIGEPGTVAAVLSENGFDAAEIAPKLAAGAARYREDNASAPDRGVFGSPFYIVGDERFWGQDRLADLDRHLAGTLRSGSRAAA